MGTHSTVKFYNKYNHCLLAVYNQYDGYITGEGALIYEFFQDKDFRGNGFDDEALMYVLYKKKGAYHTYATTERDIEEYNYEIYDTDEGIRISILEERYSENGLAYTYTLRYGSLEDLKRYIDIERKREEDIINSKM